jgi:hypothetical protein
MLRRADAVSVGDLVARDDGDDVVVTRTLKPSTHTTRLIFDDETTETHDDWELVEVIF